MRLTYIILAVLYLYCGYRAYLDYKDPHMMGHFTDPLVIPIFWVGSMIGLVALCVIGWDIII